MAGLLAAFEAEDDADAGGARATQICMALQIHMRIEEAIFYPEARMVADEDTRDEAQVEHDGLKRRTEDILQMQPTGALFRARVKALAEFVKRHVCDEEHELFSKVRDGDLDLDDIGARLADRERNLEGAAERS